MSYSNEIVQEENPYLLIFLIALALSILLVSIIFYFWSFRLKNRLSLSDCVNKKSFEMCRNNNSSINSLTSSVSESSDNESLMINSQISYEPKGEYESFSSKMLKLDNNKHKSANFSSKDKNLLNQSKNMNASKSENNGLKKKRLEKRKTRRTKSVNGNKKKLKLKSNKKQNSLEISSIDYESSESSGEYFDQRIFKNVKSNLFSTINDKNTIKSHRMQHLGFGIKQNLSHFNHPNTMSSYNDDAKQNLNFKQINNMKNNHSDYYSSENVFPHTSHFISFDNSFNDSTKHMSKPILRDHPEHSGNDSKETKTLSQFMPSNLSNNSNNPTDQTIAKNTIHSDNDARSKESEDRLHLNSSNFHSPSNVKNYQPPQLQLLSGFYPTYTGIATNMLPNLPILMYPIGICPIPLDPWPFTSTVSNIPKTSSSDIAQDLKIGRHGAPLKISIREHQKMMNELHIKALERIGRMEPANKEHYKLG